MPKACQYSRNTTDTVKVYKQQGDNLSKTGLDGITDQDRVPKSVIVDK